MTAIPKREKFSVLVAGMLTRHKLCAVCNVVMLIQFLVFINQNPKTQYLSKYTSRGKMLSRTLGNLHNLSKRVPIRTNFAACQAVNVLVPLLKAEVALFSAKSLLVLACLIDEENNHLIMADEGKVHLAISVSF